MPAFSKFSILLPVFLSMAAVILTGLALFSGRQQGFLEDYAIARLNTSMIGHDVFAKAAQDKDKDKDKGKGDVFDILRDKWQDLKDDTRDKANQTAANIADDIADKIGVADWYSLHVMNSCQGQYSPKPTDIGASLNVTNCTDPAPNYRFNLTQMLDHQIKAGPLHINLADLDWPDSIQEKLDILNDALLALFSLYAIGFGVCALTFLCSLFTLTSPESRGLVLLNLALAIVAAIATTAGSIVITIATIKGVDELNAIGHRAGILAEKGTKFLIITWVASGCMILASSYWLSHATILKRHQRWQRPKQVTV